MRYLILIALIFTSSCGFQLRGSVTLPPALSEIAVKDGTTDIAPDLRYALENAGVRVSNSAAMVLVVKAEKYDKRVLSVDSLGRALEYGLSYRVIFSLQGENGVLWISDASITQSRDLRFEATAVLGTASEEAQLKTEMRRDAISQILRQLQYAKEPVALPVKETGQPLMQPEPQ